MENVKEKKITNGKDITCVRLIDDGFYPMIQIIKSFNEKNNVITFSMWDDFSFEGYTRDKKCMEESIKLELTIDIQDPLYSNFSKLIGNDEEIVIDDDHTYEFDIKTMKISRSSNGIDIVFKNNEEKPDTINKFNIFIKNIMEDGRSKLFGRNDNMKERLILFFNEVEKEFLEKEEQER